MRNSMPSQVSERQRTLDVQIGTQSSEASRRYMLQQKLVFSFAVPRFWGAYFIRSATCILILLSSSYGAKRTSEFFSSRVLNCLSIWSMDSGVVMILEFHTRLHNTYLSMYFSNVRNMKATHSLSDSSLLCMN